MMIDKKAGWEDIEERLRITKAPKEQRRMMQQELQRRQEEGIDPGRRISPEEYFSSPEALRNQYNSIIKHLEEYPSLVQSLLEIPEDVLRDIVKANELGDREFEEIKATINAVVDQIAALNSQVTS